MQNTEGKTEIIVVLDGYQTDLPADPRVKVIHNPTAVGQRAGTNQAAKLSKAKWLMKVDAHCAFDKGFDVKMMAAMEGHDDWTMVPVMRNLHVFNWVCEDGHSRYQSPSGPCTTCAKPTRKDVVWIPKKRPESTSYCFDSQPHFQYFNAYRKRPGAEPVNGLSETMSLQGSCFMLTRDKYWELDICDESFGSWGSQGIEVACKTWLSGGRVVVNNNTWYAHMFRTQGGDFSFPYPMSGSQQEKAKALARKIWFDNLWPKQTRPLSWLLEKFWPIPGWTDAQLAQLKAWPLSKKENEKLTPAEVNVTVAGQEKIMFKPASVGIVYYTDNRLDEKIMQQVQELIKLPKLPIVSVSLKPINFGKNIVLPLERGPLTMFKQILTGLEALDTDYVFLCEHDVLYHQTHFSFRPPSNDVYYYNMNCWQLRSTDGFAVYWDCKRLSQLCADRKFLIQHYKKRIEMVEKNGFSRRMGFEPGSHGRPERVDDFKAGEWYSPIPNIDIKHGKNLTEARWNTSQFRSQRSCRNWKEADQITGWGKGANILKI